MSLITSENLELREELKHLQSLLSNQQHTVCLLEQENASKDIKIQDLNQLTEQLEA